MNESFADKILSFILTSGSPITFPLFVVAIFISFKASRIKEWTIQLADGFRSKEIKEEHERQKKELTDYIEALKKELNICQCKIDDLAKSNVFLNAKIDILSQNLSDLKDQNTLLLQLISDKKKK